MLTKALKQKGIKVLHVDGTQEIRIECPKCRKDGLKYEDFKLYYNEIKRVGHCKRCEWVGGYKRLLELLKLKKLTFSAPSLKELRREFSGNGQRTDSNAESVLPKKVKPAWLHRTSKRYLQKRGLTKSDSIRYGFLYCTRGYFQKRLIIPIFDERGRYRTFVARYIGRSKSRQIEKYLYPKGCRTGRLLGDLYPNKKAKRKRFVILVEGRFDSIHLAPLGVCTFGANLTWNQVQILREAGIKRVVICFDHDKKRKARRNVKQAIKRARQKLRKYFNVGVIWLPQRDSDPTDYSKKKIWKWAERSLS